MNRARIASIALVAALVALLLVTASSSAAMRSKKLSATLCETTGGGKIVKIPGFPGERIDRRLLADIRYLERRYKIFVTDGYSNDGVHASNGEHPMGLALDLAPNAARGGTWRQITALARFAEPRQNRPVAPFRWVGYDGDAGHGRGHHLHLSWDHSETKPGGIARTVYTMRCPDSTGGNGGGPGSGGAVSDGPSGSSGGIGGTAKRKKAKTKKRKRRGQSSGGILAGAPSTRSASTSGGIGAAPLRAGSATPLTSLAAVIETGGVDAR